MVLTLDHLSRLLAAGRIRHHVDRDETVIRVAFVTHGYRNPRSERLAILGIAPVEGGSRCRVSLERAFDAGHDARATCLTLCRAIGETPLACVQFDAASETLRLVAEIPIEDGSLTPRQLFAMLDAVVAAAESGQRELLRSWEAGGWGPSREAA